MAEIAKLRIERKRFYEINVNDNGDTIIFDTLDFELPFKLNETMKKCEEIRKKAKRQTVLIDKKEEKPDGFLTNKDYEYLNVTEKAFAEMRKAWDAFLGKDGCKKIFGDTNYFEMFDDLYEVLEPHFVKIGFTSNNVEEKIAEKYSDTDDDTLE